MTAVGRVLDDFSKQRRPLRSLGASGQLGYGIPTPAFEAGLARAPDMIGVDMGSIDIGPAYLGGGKMAPTRVGAKRDLRKVLRGGWTFPSSSVRRARPGPSRISTRPWTSSARSRARTTSPSAWRWSPPTCRAPR
jgi:hypothetical protein